MPNYKYTHHFNTGSALPCGRVVNFTTPSAHDKWMKTHQKVCLICRLATPINIETNITFESPKIFIHANEATR